MVLPRAAGALDGWFHSRMGEGKEGSTRPGFSIRVKRKVREQKNKKNEKKRVAKTRGKSKSSKLGPRSTRRVEVNPCLVVKPVELSPPFSENKCFTRRR